MPQVFQSFDFLEHLRLNSEGWFATQWQMCVSYTINVLLVHVYEIKDGRLSFHQC